MKRSGSNKDLELFLKRTDHLHAAFFDRKEHKQVEKIKKSESMTFVDEPMVKDDFLFKAVNNGN